MMGKLDSGHNYRPYNNGGKNKRRALTHIRKPPRMEYSRTAEKGSAASRTAQKISSEKRAGLPAGGRRTEKELPHNWRIGPPLRILRSLRSPQRLPLRLTQEKEAGKKRQGREDH